MGYEWTVTLVMAGAFALWAALTWLYLRARRDQAEAGDETQDDFTLSIERQRAMLERRNGQ